MKIVIQGYWGAEVKSVKYFPKEASPEEYLKKSPEIYICDVVIDEKLVGTVAWNSKELSIVKRKSPLQALKEANKRNRKGS